MWARIRSTITRHTSLTERIMQARDALRVYDRTIRHAIQAREKTLGDTESVRADVRFRNYAELRKLYRRGSVGVCVVGAALLVVLR